MFYHLEGTVSEFGPDHLVLDCRGLGFYISITPLTASALKLGETKRIYISESIGENNFDLYGFLSSEDKRFFELLTTVSGIGPKAALSLLSSNNADSLSLIILNGNESALTACPGIGKKTAQRIILELKDKIAKEFSSSSEPSPVISSIRDDSNKAYKDAVAALSVLGYSQNETAAVLKQINITGLTSDEIIREVLKFMI